MKAIQLAVVTALVLATYAFGDADVAICFKTIEYTLNASNSVMVEVEASPPDSVYGFPLALRGVTFVWDGDTIAVPTNILAEMLCPRLDSIIIQAGLYRGGVNGNAEYRHLSVNVCDPRLDADRVLDQYKRLQVRLLFWGGQLREIDVGVPSRPDAVSLGFFGCTVWRVDEGFSWKDVRYPTIASLLDAAQGKSEELQPEVFDPFRDPLPAREDVSANGKGGRYQIRDVENGYKQRVGDDEAQ